MRGFIVRQLERIDIEGQVLKSLLVSVIRGRRRFELLVELFLFLTAELLLRLEPLFCTLGNELAGRFLISQRFI